MAPNKYPDSTASSKLRGLNSVGGSSALGRSVPPKAGKHARRNAKSTEARSVFIRRAYHRSSGLDCNWQGQRAPLTPESFRDSAASLPDEFREIDRQGAVPYAFALDR